jgi:tagatose-6-phosphate ketose/aldose isomerase
LNNALEALLSLPETEKAARGLTDTPREIHQQPETWKGTFARLAGEADAIRSLLTRCGFGEPSPQQPAVILAGAGTSDYIGRAVSRVLRRHWQADVAAVPSTELLTHFDDFVLPHRPCLLISFSRSGDSSEGVAVLDLALEHYPQVHHLVITCNAAGSMAKRAGVTAVVLDDAVNDRGLAMTSSFSNMVVAGQVLGHIREPHLYVPLLHSLVAMGQRLLPQAADTAAELARQQFTRVCFLGSGSLQAVADESALKVLELNAGKIATVAESPLGLRHGPLSFVDASTLVVACLSGHAHRRRYELDLLRELRRKRLGGCIVAVAPQSDREVNALADRVLALDAPEDFPDSCRPPVDVIFGQLLGLFFAMENGITPDTPSEHGAISRVVSHVTIYTPA